MQDNYIEVIGEAQYSEEPDTWIKDRYKAYKALEKVEELNKISKRIVVQIDERKPFFKASDADILNARKMAPDWIEGMLTFIGKIIKKYDGDCVLESNGDTPIVMRKDGVVIVDDSKLRGTQRFPFHHLGIEVEEGNLEIV